MFLCMYALHTRVHTCVNAFQYTARMQIYECHVLMLLLFVHRMVCVHHVVCDSRHPARAHHCGASDLHLLRLGARMYGCIYVFMYMSF